jgi:D-alanine-D-alanine ligase
MDIPPIGRHEFTEPVAVLTGGWSRERDRSLLSGRAVKKALTNMGIETIVLDVDDSRDELLSGLEKAELAFLAIAGRGAEDGRLQGLLETLRIPYTGSGVLASAVGMHKLTAKAVAATAGVRVPKGVQINKKVGIYEEAQRIEGFLGLPVIIKPISEGGSIGLQVVTTVEDLATALVGVGDGSMAETFHPGRSVSVGVLEDAEGSVHVLPPLEAKTPNGIYSYAAKRGSAACDYHCPARLSAQTLKDLQHQAVTAHRALHCHSYSRHDFVVTDDGKAWWLEVNTLPGLSRKGNLAQMVIADGLTYEQLLLHILRGAVVDRRSRA